MQSKMKCWFLLQLLLAEQALCRAPPPGPRGVPPLPGTPAQEGGAPASVSRPPLRGPRPQASPLSEAPVPSEGPTWREDRAQRLLSSLGAKLQGWPQEGACVRPNASCGELLAASAPSAAALFPQELLGLAVAPVLVAASCAAEAGVLVLRLYALLGADDTDELLTELGGLMARGELRPRAPGRAEPEPEPHLQAVMFNIRRLASEGNGEGRQGGAGSGTEAGRCDGWARVNGTLLLGEAAGGAPGGLEEAVRACESLGARCAGVSHDGALDPGLYRAIMTPGSRAVPSDHPDSECWIRQCVAEDPPAPPGGRRARRSSPPRRAACTEEQERRVHGVVEWFPGVSTFYNLGTAVYYAAVDCPETARERALLSAVDLGTDALMAATGGAAGVAGYAVGAGFKTGLKAGIKYLMSSMSHEEDLLVNQHSWEDGEFSVQ